MKSNRLDGEAGCHFAGRMTAHAVGDDEERQPSSARKQSSLLASPRRYPRRRTDRIMNLTGTRR